MATEINAVINCMGYGYNVKVLINGIDIGVKGGQSESKRLFNTDHPMKSEAAPEIRERLFVFKEGENTIHIEFTKTGGETDRITVELQAGDNPEPVASFVSTDASGTFDKTIIL